MSWLSEALGTVPWASILMGSATVIGTAIVVLNFRNNRKRERKADLQAALVKTGANSWRFRISNVGKAAARHVRAEFPGDRGAIIASEIQNKIPIAMLEPGDCVDLVAAPHSESARQQTVKLAWVDDASKSNEKTIVVQLF